MTDGAIAGLAEDEPGVDDDWPVRGPAKGIRLGVPLAALVVALLLAAGFWGGAIAEKNHRGSTSSAAAAFAGRFRAGAATGGTAAATGGFRGGGFGGAGATSAASGTISVVDGNTLYVLTSTGSLVKVSLGATTAVTRSAKTAAAGLRPGDTVVVQGTAAANGNVTATSVTATAPGATSSAGG